MSAVAMNSKERKNETSKHMLNAMMAHQNVHARIPNKINAPFKSTLKCGNARRIQYLEKNKESYALSNR